MLNREIESKANSMLHANQIRESHLDKIADQLLRLTYEVRKLKLRLDSNEHNAYTISETYAKEGSSAVYNTTSNWSTKLTSQNTDIKAVDSSIAIKRENSMEQIDVELVTSPDNGDIHNSSKEHKEHGGKEH